jgi:hypothetical protein
MDFVFKLLQAHASTPCTEYLRIDFLLFSSEALGPLLDFVNATGRFADLLR